MASYKKNYIKIYFWQSLSFVLNFVALFIVTPLISNNSEVFGIYSVCVSFGIFLQYADLGFLNAGKKYASEACIIEDCVKEKNMFLHLSLFSLQ